MKYDLLNLVSLQQGILGRMPVALFQARELQVQGKFGATFDTIQNLAADMGNLESLLVGSVRRVRTRRGNSSYQHALETILRAEVIVVSSDMRQWIGVRKTYNSNGRILGVFSDSEPIPFGSFGWVMSMWPKDTLLIQLYEILNYRQRLMAEIEKLERLMGEFEKSFSVRPIIELNWYPDPNDVTHNCDGFHLRIKPISPTVGIIVNGVSCSNAWQIGHGSSEPYFPFNTIVQLPKGECWETASLKLIGSESTRVAPAQLRVHVE